MNHLVTKRARWRGENVASASGGISPPDASPPRFAQLMGITPRGCLVLVLGPQPRGGIFSSGPTLVCHGSVPQVYPAYPGKARWPAAGGCATGVIGFERRLAIALVTGTPAVRGSDSPPCRGGGVHALAAANPMALAEVRSGRASRTAPG
jgi:hypothetical protein